jgi:hypothetical protein
MPLKVIPAGASKSLILMDAASIKYHRYMPVVAPQGADNSASVEKRRANRPDRLTLGHVEFRVDSMRLRYLFTFGQKMFFRSR